MQRQLLQQHALPALGRPCRMAALGNLAAGSPYQSLAELHPPSQLGALAALLVVPMREEETLHYLLRLRLLLPFRHGASVCHPFRPLLHLLFFVFGGLASLHLRQLARLGHRLSLLVFAVYLFYLRRQAVEDCLVVHLMHLVVVEARLQQDPYLEDLAVHHPILAEVGHLEGHPSMVASDSLEAPKDTQEVVHPMD